MTPTLQRARALSEKREKHTKQHVHASGTCWPAVSIEIGCSVNRDPWCVDSGEYHNSSRRTPVSRTRSRQDDCLINYFILSCGIFFSAQTAQIYNRIMLCSCYEGPKHVYDSHLVETC